MDCTANRAPKLEQGLGEIQQTHKAGSCKISLHLRKRYVALDCIGYMITGYIAEFSSTTSGPKSTLHLRSPAVQEAEDTLKTRDQITLPGSLTFANKYRICASCPCHISCHAHAQQWNSSSCACRKTSHCSKHHLVTSVGMCTEAVLHFAAPGWHHPYRTVVQPMLSSRVSTTAVNLIL